MVRVDCQQGEGDLVVLEGAGPLLAVVNLAQALEAQARHVVLRGEAARADRVHREGLKAEVEEATRIFLERGWSPERVLNDGLVEGMRIVGIDFRDGILFVPEVLLAANAMKGGMAILAELNEHEVNLDLTTPNPPFNFYDTEHPIYTHSRFLPGSIVEDSKLKDVLLAEGCVIRKASITHSVIGVRSIVGAGTVIQDTVVMGADYYERRVKKDIPLGIGKRCKIEGAIIDKNVQVGDGVVIKPFPRGTDIDAGTWVVQDGVVVIPKDTIIPAKMRIEP